MAEPQQIEKVRSRWRFLRTIALSVVAATVICVGAFKATRAYQTWSASERLPRELPVRSGWPLTLVGPPEEPPNPYILKLRYPPEASPRHLLDGNFAIVRRMGDLPGVCQDTLQASFVNYWNPKAIRERVAFADPGEEFEETDAIRGGLPFRRLIFGGVEADRCFVYFESGGRIHPASHCMAVMDFSQPQAIWVGEWRGWVSGKAANIEELRRKLSRLRFWGEDQSGC